MKSNEIGKQLFLRHYRELVATAFFLLHDEEESKDAVQEVFIRLLDNGTKLEEDTARSYLITAVRHDCLNRLANLSVKQRVMRECLLEERTSDTDWQQTEREIAILQEAIDDLEPPVCRDIIKMHYWSQMKFREVAQRLGISETMVYRYLKQAMKQLRNQLKER
jgi:RNA polymerase sigma factor (sigma-70 family)